MRRVRKMLLTRPLFFLTDVLSLVPTDALYFAIKRPFWPFVRSNRLLKLNRILEFVSQTETSTNFPYLFRITYIYMAIIVIIHWNACSFVSQFIRQYTCYCLFIEIVNLQNAKAN